MKTCKTCGAQTKRLNKGHCKKCYTRDYNKEYDRKKATIFHGDPNGTGKLMFYDGSFHIGEFRKGKRHGKGAFHFADGMVHEGVWQDGILKEGKRDE